MPEALPVLARPGIAAAALVYLGCVAAIGWWSAARTRSARDFFIAGQRLGLWITGLGTMSAAFSGFVFLGGPGLTYRLGLASLFILLPLGFTAGLLCWVLGRRLRLLAGAFEVYTIPDALACRFPGRGVRASATVAVIAGTVGYLAAQLLALGVLLEAVFGLRDRLGAWGLPAAAVAGLLVILFYSGLGGMVAGAWTDLVQGLLMLVAALVVAVRALEVTGGWAGLAGSLAGSEAFAGFLEPFGRASPRLALGFYFVFGVGVLGQPQMLHRFFMLRDVAVLRWMPLVLGGSQAVCVLVWLGIGLAVPALVAQGALAPLADPDTATPVFVLGHLPAALGGLVLAGGLAAIMSTADSFLNLGAAALVRDLPRAFGRPLERELAWGRIATVGLGIAALGLALAYDDLVALLGTFAFGTFAAALAPALAVGLNWHRVTGLAATASIGVGLALNLGLEIARRWAPTAAWPLPADLLPAAVALAGSLATLVLVTWWTDGRDPPIAAEVLEVMAS